MNLCSNCQHNHKLKNRLLIGIVYCFDSKYRRAQQKHLLNHICHNLLNCNRINRKLICYLNNLVSKEFMINLAYSMSSMRKICICKLFFHLNLNRILICE